MVQDPPLNWAILEEKLLIIHYCTPADEHGSVSGYDGPYRRYDCAATGVYRFNGGVCCCRCIEIPCVQVRKFGAVLDYDAESVSLVGLASPVLCSCSVQ